MRRVHLFTQKFFYIKVLVLCDDLWHDALVPHQGLAGLEGIEFSFDWIESVKAWSPEAMKRYPLVILTKANHFSVSDQTSWMTEEVQAVFYSYVQEGGGLVIIHSEIVGYEHSLQLRRILGGAFSHHPPECAVIVTPTGKHPLSAGCPPFTLNDDHFFNFGRSQGRSFPEHAI